MIIAVDWDVKQKPNTFQQHRDAFLGRTNKQSIKCFVAAERAMRPAENAIKINKKNYNMKKSCYTGAFSLKLLFASL